MPGRTPSWYSDPDDATLARWHDGQDWTEFTMVIAEWTSTEPPPPPEGWSPPPSPTAGLTPAFGAPAPGPAPPEEETAPAAEPGGSPHLAGSTPESDAPRASAPPAPADHEPGGGAPAGTTSAEEAPPVEEPRGLARLAGEPGTRAFGSSEAPAPGTRAFGSDPASTATDPDAEPTTTPDVDTASFEDRPQGGVRIDAPTAGPGLDEPADGEGNDEDEDEEGDEDGDEDGPTSGSVQAVGPEAPGIDWGVGPQALKPVRRPSGWHLDEDGNPIGEPLELPKRTLGQQYRHAPIWVRVAIPLVVVGLAALAVTSLLGGGGGGDDDSTDRLFSTRDGTLDDEALDEPGMDDALTRARQQGVPTEVTDKDLSALIKGVCTAARRSLVSLSLSESLADTGLEVSDLGTAATAIGNGSLEYCPDQEASLGQVVSVLITRTQRMLATSTTT